MASPTRAGYLGHVAALPPHFRAGSLKGTVLAHAAVRHGGRKDRNRGYIAVAHELCRLVYVVWRKEINYMETPPARPGQQSNGNRSRRMKSKSRPGTGQPADPMAVAAV